MENKENLKLITTLRNSDSGSNNSNTTSWRSSIKENERKNVR